MTQANTDSDSYRVEEMSICMRQAFLLNRCKPELLEGYFDSQFSWEDLTAQLPKDRVDMSVDIDQVKLVGLPVQIRQLMGQHWEQIGQRPSG